MADRSPLNHFIERFVLPLAVGGPVHVDGLMPPAALKAFVADRALDATLVAKVAKAMHDRLARVGPVGSVEALPLDAVALCAVWHNLLAMTHPEVKGKSRLRRKVRQWSDVMLQWVDAPRTRAEVALRHALVGRVEALGRVDTHVSFWAGYADFLGVPPPRALVAWPSVRRVEETRRRADLFELLRALEPEEADAEEDLAFIACAALAASPLTDISLADRPGFIGFGWGPSLVNAITDPALRGAAQRIVLRKGPASVRAVEAATLVAARASATSPAVAEALLRFHLELVVTDALSGRAPGAPASPTSIPQPLGLDALLRLGHARAAALVGVDEETLRRFVPVDPSRPAPRDPPSAPLLQRAGLLEVRS